MGLSEHTMGAFFFEGCVQHARRVEARFGVAPKPRANTVLFRIGSEKAMRPTLGDMGTNR